jgi:hypothetical protein
MTAQHANPPIMNTELSASTSGEQEPKTPFGQILGSGSYMVISLGLEGEITSTEDYKRKISDYISKLLDGYETVSSQNLANALMLEWVLDQNPQIQNWYSRRKFTKDDKSVVYSSLWNGYRVTKYGDMTSGVVIELGSGAARFYKCIDNVWQPLSESVEDEDYDKFWKLVEEDDWTKESPIDYLTDHAVYHGIIDKEDLSNLVVFGTQKAREMADFDKWDSIKVDVLTQEEESLYEYLSVVNAHKEAPQASLQSYDLKATVGYGKGSYQGYNMLAYNTNFMKPIGLSKLMMVLGDKNLSKTIKFEDEYSFDNAIELAKDELYKYEDGFWKKLSHMFMSLFD